MQIIMDKKKLSELAVSLKIYPQVLENIRVTDKKAAQDDPDVQAVVKEVERVLGETGRILVRVSGTEPVVRVMVEVGLEETCREHVAKVVDVIKEKSFST